MKTITIEKIQIRLSEHTDTNDAINILIDKINELIQTVNELNFEVAGIHEWKLEKEGI